MNRNIKLITLDCIGSALSLYLAFLIRFEFEVPGHFGSVLIEWLPWFILSQIIVFYIRGLYARIWRYTSLIDLYAILGSSLASFSLSLIFVFFAYGMIGYPRSVLLLYFILNTITIIALRLSVRVYYSHYYKSSIIKRSSPKKVLLLIGAGKTGEKIIRDIRTTSRDQYTVVGFVDDNPDKRGALLHGKEIFCSVNELPNLDIKYDELLITMPSADGDQMRRIVKICKQTGKRYKTVPSMTELIDNEPTIDNIRDVNYSDLLGRQEVQLDMNSIESMLQGKRVLITGAGGSIGSELVKQCLTFNPAEIICVDFSEEKIYDLEQESKKNCPILLNMILISIRQ